MNHAYCVGSSDGWKKMRFQLALNKTFFSNPQPLTHRRLKQRQRKKISKTMLSAHLLPPPHPPHLSHRFSTQSSQCHYWKTSKYSILTVNELGTPVLESSARISKFYAPTDSEHKFNKMGIETWLPIGYNLGSSDWEPAVITAPLCSSGNGKSFQVLYTHP